MAGIKTGIDGQINNNIQTNGLVAYWDAAYKKSYTSGSLPPSTFNLASGSLTPTGSLKNDTGFVGLPTASWDFDGADDYIDCGDSADFTFGNGTTDSAFSLSTWVNMTDSAEFIPIGKDSTGQREYVIRLLSDKIHFYLVDNSTGGYIGRYYDLTMSGQEGNWLHIATTYNGSGATSGIKIYLNGARVDDEDYSGGSYTAMENTTAPLMIGLQSVSSLYADGMISNVQIYNLSLSAGDVLQNYNAQKDRFGL